MDNPCSLCGDFPAEQSNNTWAAEVTKVLNDFSDIVITEIPDKPPQTNDTEYNFDLNPDNTSVTKMYSGLIVQIKYSSKDSWILYLKFIQSKEQHHHCYPCIICEQERCYQMVII